MAKPFNLDLSKFKVLRQEKGATLLQHDDGHSLRVAHAPLSVKMRSQLMALTPIQAHEAVDKFAKGGQAKMAANPKLYESEKENISKERHTDEQIIEKKARIDEQNRENVQHTPVIPPLPYPDYIERRMNETDITPRKMSSGGHVCPHCGAEKFADGGEEEEAGSPNLQVDALPQSQATQAAPVAASNAALPSIDVSKLPAGPASAPAASPGASAPQQQPGPSASAQGTPAYDPWGVETYQKYALTGAGEQKAGAMMEAAGQSAAAQGQAAALQKGAAKQQEQQLEFQRQFNELDTNRKSFQQHIMNNQIDAEHYVKSLSTGSKIMTAIGLVIGGLGGPGNAAQKMFEDNINRDIQAQRDNLGREQNLLSENMRQFGNLRDATDMTRAQTMEIISNQIKAAGARAGSQMAMGNAMKAAGAVDAQIAPIMSQMAMRRTLLSGAGQQQAGGSSDIAPMRIRALLPEAQQEQAFKQLDTAKKDVSFRDNAMHAFDRIAQLKQNGLNYANPLARSEIAGLQEKLVAQLGKDLAGRYTEADAATMSKALTGWLDNPELVERKRQDFLNTINQNMHYSLLDSVMVNPESEAKYDRFGRPKFKLGPVQ